MKSWIRDFALRLLANAMGLMAIVLLLGDRHVQLGGLQAALFVVGIWCVLTSALRPILFAIKLVTSPLNLISLGLYGLVLGFLMNVIVLASIGVAGAIDGFKVTDYWSALQLAALFSVVNSASSAFIGSKKEK